MNLIFMGTPSFAVPALKRLCEDGHRVTLVVTQPDKPQGRHRVLTASPVKELALSLGIPVFQPASLKSEEAYDRLAAETPEVIVVVAYGKILPARLLALPRWGCINVHGSLLPRYRGAAPIQWTVINGEKEAGVTTMKMDVGLDTGDMLLCSRRPLHDTTTSGELYEQLAVDGAALLSETLVRLAAGTLVPQKQKESEATYAPMLDKSFSPLCWEQPATVLHNRVRGLNPWPCASCEWDGKTLKVYRSKVGEPTDAAPGTVVSASPPAIACGDGRTLVLQEVQYEGAKRMAAEDFWRGHAVVLGTRLNGLSAEEKT